jgi:branched-chain amino acid transport system substrate-binding protein
MRFPARLRFPLAATAAVLGIAAPTLTTSVGISAPVNDKGAAEQPAMARVGRLLGAAYACRNISQSRIKAITDKIVEVIKASAISERERKASLDTFDRSVAEGLRLTPDGNADCVAIGRDIANLETSTATVAAAPVGAAPSGFTPPVVTPIPTVTDSTAPAAPVAAPGRSQTEIAALAPVQAPAAGGVVPGLVRGVTDREIRFGISAPLTGPAKELGRQMKMGIETAFSVANEIGGVHGRQLRLIAVDDGYEPGRTAESMKQLYEKEQVFGVVGNVGTPTAAVSAPFALERRMLFFGAFSGAALLRRDPPDRYVFNYRASYAEETEAAVRYLVKVRKIKPEQIVVFAQQDAYGDAGFSGVERAMRGLRKGDAGAVTRLSYKRNSIDVDEAVAQLRKVAANAKAVVMVATYRAAAKFIEKTRDVNPALIYTNVSFVGGTSLADELMLLGPKYADGIIVTQVTPAVDGYSSLVLEYKSALAKFFPGEAADYVSLEGYVSANVLVEALRRTGAQLDTERLVDALENLRDYDMGLGTPITFGRGEHQGLHKVWGTQLDVTGRYQTIDLQ